MIKLSEFPILPEDELRLKSKHVNTKEEAEEINEMLMSSFPETGAYAVAAPQIGLLARAFVAKLPETDTLQFFCNPVITDEYDTITFPNEGCLSFPGKNKHTHRYKYIVMEYLDENFEQKKVVASDLEAVIFQHEVDHLNGILYFDKKADLTVRNTNKIGRNEACPCKSGKKYKKCCLK